MAVEGATGRFATGAAATGAGIGTGAAAGGSSERTMGRVTGNSVSDERRRGGAAGSMGIGLLCSGSVAAKPRSAPTCGDTGWWASCPARRSDAGEEPAEAVLATFGATPTMASSAASTATSLIGLRCSGQPVPPSLLPTRSTLPGNSAYCTKCKACMLSALTTNTWASITSSCTW